MSITALCKLLEYSLNEPRICVKGNKNSNNQIKYKSMHLPVKILQLLITTFNDLFIDNNILNENDNELDDDNDHES